ncbi:MAG: hypothetical protein V1674_01360 [Candidatus Omnitrophota bacterium]
MEGFKKVRQSILRAKDMAISGHINPGGDSIGSLLSLGLALDSLSAFAQPPLASLAFGGKTPGVNLGMSAIREGEWRDLATYYGGNAERCATARCRHYVLKARGFAARRADLAEAKCRRVFQVPRLLASLDASRSG